MKKRMADVTASMQAKNIDHLLVAPGPSFVYLTGVGVHASERLTLFGLRQDGHHAILAPLLEEDNFAACGCALFTYRDEEWYDKACKAFLDELQLTHEHVVALERDQMRLFEYDAVAVSKAQFVDGKAIVMEKRLLKDETEIAWMQKAASIVDQALERTLSLCRVGMTELELAAELELQMRKLGSQGTPFETIVGSGYRGALPHGGPTDKAIVQGELVVIDYGAMVGGYNADSTRTIAFGEPSLEDRKVYETVRQANKAGISAVLPGNTAQDVDRAARSCISLAGYGEYFTHRTGHGLGLAVHEFPSIMEGNDLVLRPGMVFTVEPGIYIPARVGVRIEDDVVVTEEGVSLLTHFSKELIIV